MQRHSIRPRDNWQRIVEQQGLTFHSAQSAPGVGKDRPYWDESACYEFTSAEIDHLEAAANTLQEMCLAALQCSHSNERSYYLWLAGWRAKDYLRWWLTPMKRTEQEHGEVEELATSA